MREEGVRRVLAVQELTRCVSTSIEAGATPASRSGVPLSFLALCSGLVREPRGCPDAAAPAPCGAAPGPAGLPLPLTRTPPEGLGSPAGGRGQAAEPSPFPQTALRAIKPTEWARKARLWETCGGSGRDLRVKAKLKDQQPQLTPVTSTEILRLFFFFFGLETFLSRAA